MNVGYFYREEIVRMKRTDRLNNTVACDPAYRNLYKGGAVAALIAAAAFRRNMDAEYMLLRGLGLIKSGPATAPGSVLGWLELLQGNRLLGLVFLNVFDMVNYALVGLLFLALYFALRRRGQAGMTIAAALSLVSVSAYFASNQAFTMLSLSKQYAAASTDVHRAMLLAAGQATLAIHNKASFQGGGLYLSFLLVSLAGLLISAVMLRSDVFRRATAYAGLLANGFGLGYYLFLILAPQLVFLPLSISAVFLLAWYGLTSVGLWKLGGRQAVPSAYRGSPYMENVSQPM
jgi:hypothetical protein